MHFYLYYSTKNENRLGMLIVVLLKTTPLSVIAKMVETRTLKDPYEILGRTLILKNNLKNSNTKSNQKQILQPANYLRIIQPVNVPIKNAAVSILKSTTGYEASESFFTDPLPLL